MTDTRSGNGTKRLYWILGIVVSIISIVVFFETSMDKRIEKHPAITTLQANQENIKKQLDKMDDKLDRILQRQERKP